jgi:hypothetical protein
MNAKGMTALRRRLIFRVADGYDPCLPILHFLDSMHRCDEILGWLIGNRLTGKNLCEFLQIQFGNSMLNMTKFIFMKLDKVTEKQAILLGRDVKLG